MSAFGTYACFETCTPHWSMDASIVRCSMLCQTFIRHCRSSSTLRIFVWLIQIWNCRYELTDVMILGMKGLKVRYQRLRSPCVNRGWCRIVRLHSFALFCVYCYAPPLWRWCASDACLSVAYIGPKSRTERPRKTKIGTDVGHVTRDWDTTFKVKRSKVNL